MRLVAPPIDVNPTLIMKEVIVPQRSHRTLRVACLLTGIDWSAMKKCGRNEHNEVYMSLFMFIAQFALITVLMSHALMYMMEKYNAWLFGLLVAFITVSLEIRMLSSDWSARGVLAPTFQRPSFYGMLLFRIALGVAFSGVYGTAAELALQDDKITEVLRAQQDDANKALQERVEAQLATLKSAVQSIERRKAEEVKVRQPLLNNQHALNQEIFRLNTEVVEYERLMVVEEKGLEGRPDGEGPKYLEYQNKRHTVQKKRDLEHSKLENVTDEIEKIDKRINALNDELSEAEAAVVGFDHHVTMTADPMYVAIHQDFLARYQALKSLHGDDAIGEAAKTVSLIIFVVILLLELTPIMSKLLFSQASIYHEIMTSRAQCGAARERLKAQRKLRRIQRKMQQEIPDPIVADMMGVRIVEDVDHNERRRADRELEPA